MPTMEKKNYFGSMPFLKRDENPLNLFSYAFRRLYQYIYGFACLNFFIIIIIVYLLLLLLIFL